MKSLQLYFAASKETEIKLRQILMMHNQLSNLTSNAQKHKKLTLRRHLKNRKRFSLLNYRNLIRNPYGLTKRKEQKRVIILRLEIPARKMIILSLYHFLMKHLTLVMIDEDKDLVLTSLNCSPLIS